MKPLYILDLEGTTGIYSSGRMGIHVNDITIFRPGFRKLIEMSNSKDKRIAIASRIPANFMEDILKNLEVAGIKINCGVYTKEDIALQDPDLISYKDYSKVYSDHGITDPKKEAVVIGDFLRFRSPNSFSLGYSEQEFKDFDFSKSKEVLSRNFSLNDHPYPDRNETPVYVVLPSVTINRKSLDMDYVIGYLEQMHKLGRNDFYQGIRLFSRQMVENQFVSSSDLSKRLLDREHFQDYLVLKGKDSDWKHLETIVR